MSEKGQQNSKHLQTPEKVENQKTSPRNEYTDYAPPGWEGWHRPKGLPGYDELARMVAEIRQAVQEWEQAHDLETPDEKLKLLALGWWYEDVNASLGEASWLGQAADYARHQLDYERFLEYVMDLAEEIQFIQEARVKDFGEVFAEYAEEAREVLAGLEPAPEDLAGLMDEVAAEALRAALKTMGWVNEQGEFAPRGHDLTKGGFAYLIANTLFSRNRDLNARQIHAIAKKFFGEKIGVYKNFSNGLNPNHPDRKKYKHLDSQVVKLAKALSVRP
jgi:hypothetical protein